MKIKFLIYILISFVTLSCNRKLDKTNAIKYWEIEDYQIAYFSKIGPVGPHYYEYDVFKNEYFVSTANIQNNDSCRLRMRETNGHYVSFDLCSLTKKDIYPKKVELSIEKIDSVIIFSKKESKKKKLNNKQLELFNVDWKKSKVSDLRDYKTFDSIFFPDYKYKLRVFRKKEVLNFIASSHMIADESKWVWYISEYEKGEYFDKIWNEN
jgi:hypothetical protein